jgi:hypothetical protein
MSNFEIKTQNPWAFIFPMILMIIAFFIISQARLPQLILSLSPFISIIIIVSIYELFFTNKTVIVIEGDEITAPWQIGFFCTEELKTLKRSDIIDWEIYSSKGHKTLQISTAERNYYLRARTIIFPQKSFRLFAEDFKKFMDQ